MKINSGANFITTLWKRDRHSHDPGTRFVLQMLQRSLTFEERAFGAFAEILVKKDQKIEHEIHAWLSRQPRMCIGWKPDGKDMELPASLPCWVDIDGVSVEIGSVCPEEAPPLRERLIAFNQRLVHGGMIRKAFPLMRRPDGERSFIAQLIEH